MAESQVEKIMRLLQCTQEEAEDVIRTDKLIDQGKRSPYDLDPQKEKEAKKMANVTDHKKPTVYDFKPRERKSNPTKAGIVAEIADFLENESDFDVKSLEITNKERMIAFTIGEERYEVTLIQKRKPKS